MSNLYHVLKIFLIIIIFKYQFIKCFQFNEKYPSALLLINGDIFLVSENGFKLYDSTFKTLKKNVDFTEEQKITSEVEAEKTSIAQFSDGIIIALVKNILFAFESNGEPIVQQNLNDSLTNGRYYSLIPFKIDSLYYDYIISYYDSATYFSIKYFRFSKNVNEVIENPLTFLQYTPINSYGEVANILEYGLSCVIMIIDENEKVLTCFYEFSYPEELGVTSFEISYTDIRPKERTPKFSPNHQASIIKSITSNDQKKALICYNKYYSDCICLHYNINDNEFSPEVKYFNQCKGMATTIKVYYFKERAQYMFICHKPPKGFNVVLFDSNFQYTIPNQDIKEYEPYFEYGGNCYKLYNFDIIYLSSIDDFILISDCEVNGNIFSTGNINLNRLSGENSFPLEEDYDIFTPYNNTPKTNTNQVHTNLNVDTTYINRETEYKEITNIPNIPTIHINSNVIIDTTVKKKEEVMNELNDIIQDKDPAQSYIVNGEDFTIIIKPVNEHVEESTVNIDFSECEEKLKEIYPEKEFRILQVNMESKNKNVITDQVEYKIYDEDGNEIELSICNNVNIKIEFEIKNTSLLDIELISNFKEKGIDIFNLEHEFFNDICYPYSDKNSSSDMILIDRVSDIYQNYSICGKGCEYNSFNVDKLSANCNCKVKPEISSESEEGNFKTYLVAAFLDANFGIVKCYHLFFSIKGKLENAGFWIFGMMIIIHIPIYIFYFIKGISPVINYINNELDKNGYKPNKKDKNKDITKNMKTTIQNINENIDSSPKRRMKTGRSVTNNNPPKKLNSSLINYRKTKKHKKLVFKESSPHLLKMHRHTSLSDDENAKHKKRKMTVHDKTKNISHEFEEILINHKNKNTLNERNKTKDIFQNNSIHNSNFNTLETNADIMPKNKFEKGQENYNNIISEIIIDEKDIIHKDLKKEKKRFNKSSKKLNLINELESREVLANKNDIRKNFHKKHKKKRKVNDDNIQDINNSVDKEENEYQKSKEKKHDRFPLILINANNKGKYKPIPSNYILNNYDYNEAINYEKRSICRIFFIYLISKENVFNIIFINPPLQLKPIRICIFIFSFACDFALNALFYLSDNISDRYHYNGSLRELYSLINNLTISVTSTIISVLLLFFFSNLTQSSNKIEKLFREQEILLKNNKKYKVKKDVKALIIYKIEKIMKCLKFKIIFFIILELIFILFFFYYVTSFCQIYPKTQISWLLDCISSYVISLFFTIILSYICALFYRIAIKNRKRILYKILMFIYSC